MTIDEAKKYWKYKYNRAKDYSDTHWEADERHEHQEYVEALQIAVKALEETAELKRLLSLAVVDMATISGDKCLCNIDMHCDICPLVITGRMCKWKHADAALKLLGDDKQ